MKSAKRINIDYLSFLECYSNPDFPQHRGFQDTIMKNVSLINFLALIFEIFARKYQPSRSRIAGSAINLLQGAYSREEVIFYKPPWDFTTKQKSEIEDSANEYKLWGYETRRTLKFLAKDYAELISYLWKQPLVSVVRVMNMQHYDIQIYKTLIY